MIRLDVIDMKQFLREVDQCSGVVYLCRPGRRKEDIRRNYELQNELGAQYRGNKERLRLNLEIPNTGDYFKIVNFMIGGA